MTTVVSADDAWSQREHQSIGRHLRRVVRHGVERPATTTPSEYTSTSNVVYDVKYTRRRRRVPRTQGAVTRRSTHGHVRRYSILEADVWDQWFDVHPNDDQVKTPTTWSALDANAQVAGRATTTTHGTEGGRGLPRAVAHDTVTALKILNTDKFSGKIQRKPKRHTRSGTSTPPGNRPMRRTPSTEPPSSGVHITVAKFAFNNTRIFLVLY